MARAAFPGPNGTWNAAALRANVANPFFGIPGTGEFGSRATIQAGQLLRPFPQFGDVYKYEMTDGGRRQYHAATFVLEKRTTGWWGGRFSYTLSRTEDNQFGQASTFQTRTALPQNNYDLDAEYGISNFDSPHRIILAPIMKFPNSGKGGIARAVPRRLERLSGGRTGQRLAAERRHVAPARPTSNLGLFGGRQRPNADRRSEHRRERHRPRGLRGQRGRPLLRQRRLRQSRRRAPYGNAPRTNGDARYQFRKNVDLVIAKDTTLVRQPRRHRSGSRS